MNLLLMANQGLPRNGLVALYDMGKQIALGNTGQTLIDFSGRGNSAQLGSAAGADTNDPAWGTNGLLITNGADVDNYCKSASPAFDDMAQFTVLAVLNPTGGAGEHHFWDKNSNIGISTYIQMYLSFTNSFAVTVGNTALENKNYIVAAGLTSNTDYLGFGWVNSNKQTMQKIAGTPEGTRITDALHDLRIGNNNSLDASLGSLFFYAIYNRVLSDSEYMQAYNYLKRLMSSRGITI